MATENMQTALKSPTVAVAAVGNDVYVIGGRRRLSPYHTRKVDVFNTQSRTWRSGPDLLAGISLTRAVAVGTKIYVAGGSAVVGSSTTKSMARVYVLDTGTGTWTGLDEGPHWMDNHEIAVVGGELLVFGGNNAVSSNKMQHLNLGDQTWSMDTVQMPHPFVTEDAYHQSMSLVGVGPKLWVIGGSDSLGANDIAERAVYIYDPAAKTYTAGPGLPAPSSSNESALVDGRIFVFDKDTKKIWAHTL